MFVKHVPLCFSPDIDECALAAVTGLQACQANAECRNSPGSFTCSCPAGYVMALHGQGCVGEADVDNPVLSIFKWHTWRWQQSVKPERLDKLLK